MSDRKKFKCSVCNKQFTTYQARSYHLVAVHQRRTGEIECKYEECGASFPDQQTMEQHYKYTHVKRASIKSKCPKCKAQNLFVSSDKLKVYCKSKKCAFNQKYKGDDYKYQYKGRK